MWFVFSLSKQKSQPRRKKLLIMTKGWLLFSPPSSSSFPESKRLCRTQSWPQPIWAYLNQETDCTFLTKLYDRNKLRLRKIRYFDLRFEEVWVLLPAIYIFSSPLTEACISFQDTEHQNADPSTISICQRGNQGTNNQLNKSVSYKKITLTKGSDPCLDLHERVEVGKQNH